MFKHLFSFLLDVAKSFNNQSLEKPKKRGCDDFGCGHYKASRGDYLHEGQDFEYQPGEYVRAFRAGKVNKLGFPYEGDFHFRYVQISGDGAYMRYMYVQPIVGVGDYVQKGQAIGVCQDIASKHNTPTKTMINHVHFEVLVDGEAVDPKPYYT